HRLDVRGSLGIAAQPEHGDDAATLLRCADVAMYTAKRAASGYAVYAAEKKQDTADRLTLLRDLLQAIEGGGLFLHFQPKIDFRTGRTVGVEALVRWQHPERGPIPPGRFVPLAEQTGLIKPLSRWVLEAALDQSRRWRGDGLDL